MLEFIPTKYSMQKHIAEYLYDFIKANNVKTIVETGIHYGTSSQVFLSALPEDGTLISIEPEILYDKIVADMNDPRWLIINGKSEEILDRVVVLNSPIDLFWHDSLHVYDTMTYEFEMVVNSARFIGSHDICHKTTEEAWYKFVEKYNLEVLHQERIWGLAKGLLCIE